MQGSGPVLVTTDGNEDEADRDDDDPVPPSPKDFPEPLKTTSRDTSSKTVPEDKPTTRFHIAKDDSELDRLTHCKFAGNTEKKIKWVIGIYCQ